ncbi:hypothetical protein [Bradyrhizobium sp. STM 3809]|uniref:hypothetical protein n=1 Tax=Bradyrhizobium sp. STM 3809 TaxID=551936 RepID=UPI0002408E2E|nr:hypothetical protein [Bradyrhizobium sp. STM 3809]CCE00922.1 membrane hypothetical protein [Bradyrhizobium sp. STM 3809]
MIRHWPTVFVVDLVLKFGLIYLGAILASLGTVILGGIEAVIYFALFAAALATLNVMFLMVGARVVASLRCAWIGSHPGPRSALVFVSGIGMFAGAVAMLFSFGLGVTAGAAIAALFATTNIISIAIALLFSCTFGLVARALGR